MLLLLDEPTSGMSPAETSRMIDLIASLPRTLAILMIEHDMDVVFSVADRDHRALLRRSSGDRHAGRN